MILTVLLILALICFLLAVANFPANINMVALGLLFLTLGLLLNGKSALF